VPILAASSTAPPIRKSTTIFPENLTLTLRRGSASWKLDESNGIKVLAGAQGLDAPTLVAESRTPAGWDGEVIDSIAAEAREVFLPLRIAGSTLTQLQGRKRDLLSFLNPRNGAVTLEATVPDGSRRLIDGYYLRGLDGSWDVGSFFNTRQLAGITLRCPNPFWRTATPFTASWKVRADALSPLPILPLGPGAAQALGTPNVVSVPGDAETYGVWKISGPLTQVQILDNGAGRSLTFTADVSAGQTYTIDTRRGQQGVFAPDGSRARSTLNRGAQFWPLRPGTSTVTTTVTGASVGASVSVSADVLWFTA
jgi:hypothetical protein